jgi:membrane-associated protease RseP (regulator of RpoE activity)
MGSNWFGIVAFVAALFVTIVVHETGHFLAARSFGIKVEEFFIGFGPKLFSRRRGETEYGLKGIPLGGYVRIAGMNPWQPVTDDERPRTFGAKPAWQRAVVLSAGSATHFVLGAVIMLVVFAFIGLPGWSTRLASVDPGGPAAAAGFKAGDRVLAVDGHKTGTWLDFRDVVQSSPGKQLSVVVDREGRRVTLTATPVAAPEKQGAPPVGRLGLASVEIEKESLPRAFVSSMKYTGYLTVESLKGIGHIFSPRGLRGIVDSLGGTGKRGMDSPMGLIGGGREAGNLAASGQVGYLLALLASFIVFVGIINMAPLPPLDGGHLVVLLLEKIRGKPVDMKKVAPVAAVVLTFILLFTIAIFYLDIARPVTSPF